MKKIKIESISLPGIGKINEDYLLYDHISENCTVVILADGMGGLSYGNRASEWIAYTLHDTIAEHYRHQQPEDVLRSAFIQADSVIREKCRELTCRMGAAVTIAMITNDTLYYAWQGNVRLYIKAKNELLQLNEDHVALCPQNTLLTRSVNGKGYREQIPVRKMSLNSELTLYMCTDGFYQSADKLEILRTEGIGDGAKAEFDDASVIKIKF